MLAVACWFVFQFAKRKDAEASKAKDDRVSDARVFNEMVKEQRRYHAEDKARTHERELALQTELQTTRFVIEDAKRLLQRIDQRLDG